MSQAAVLFIAVCVFCHINGDVYRAFLERAEVVQYDEEYVNASATSFKYNRTHTAINLTLLIHKDVPTDVVVNVQTYEFLSNEYRPWAVRFSRTLCNFLTMEYKLYYVDMMREGNTPLPPHCPVKAGLYKLVNHVPDNSNVPVVVPFKRFKLEVKVVRKDHVLLHYQDYTTLDRDIIYRERYG